MTRIGIIGGGFCGITLAARLLRDAQSPAHILLFERGPCIGAGLAYSTVDPQHWLNVPSERMSAFPETPDDFVRWAQTHGNGSAQGFALRSDYRRYLQDTLHDALRHSPSQFTRVQMNVVDLRPNFDLVGEDGDDVRVDQVVLAMGYLKGDGQFGPPAFPALQPTTWPQTPPKRVVVIGTGLTAVDAALSLIARYPDAIVQCISRNGLFPMPYEVGRPGFAADPMPNDASLRARFRWVRDQVRQAERQGFTWVEVFDSLRPRWEGIWQALSDRDRRQFVRHLMRIFDRYRHRIPPETYRLLCPKLRSGQISTARGHVVAVHPSGVVLTCGEIAADLVVDATGTSFCHQASSDPLLASLFQQGLVRPGPMGWGLAADAIGQVSPRVYALGPLLRGARWETTAVPELRQQVKALSEHLLCSRTC